MKIMIMKKKSEYESPRLEVEVMVYERGFASSFYFDQIEDAEEGEGEDEWI